MKKNTVTQDRTRFIGGSDIPTLLGLNQYKTREDLVLEYAGIDERNFNGNQFTEYGNLMEEKIRDYANKLLGFDCKPKCSKSFKKRIRCNTDGYDPNNKVIFEIKTNDGKHSNTIDYEVQMQLYMWKFKCKKGYLIQYKRPKDFWRGFDSKYHLDVSYFNTEFDSENVKITEIKYVPYLVKEILARIKDFWNEVEKLKGDNRE